MLWKIRFFFTFIVMLIVVFPPDAFARKMSRTEDLIVSASGIKTVRFENIAFTDLTYKGSEDTDTFTVKFKRTVEADDTEEFEDVLSYLDLDITTSGDAVTINLIHPKKNPTGFFNRLFNRKEWRVTIDIAGPTEIDMDMEAGFSEVRINSTSGTMNLDNDFSDTIVRNHAGKITVDADFCSLRCDDLDGAFDVNSDFSDINLKLAHLDGNSRAQISFGSVNIRFPRETGAVFTIDKSLGSVNFHTGGSLTYEGHKGSRRVLNNGGPRVDLHVKFGDITIRDDLQEKRISVTNARKEGYVLPMKSGSWWQYTSGEEQLTLRVVSTRSENENTIVTLAFDKNSSSPFESIDVYETDEGLYICGINGRFFGRNLSGVRFITPKLWLPYEKSIVVADSDLLGTVSARRLKDTLDTPAGKMSDVLHYIISFKDLPSREISLAPGIGFVSFDTFKLSTYDTGVSTEKTAEVPPPEPRFERGTVKSIDIKIRGIGLVSRSDVMKIMDIEEGGIYTRNEISSIVRGLEERNRFIDNAHYDIDNEGNLIVRVYEVKPHKKDFDVTGSFSRVGGVGLGLNLKVISMVGPLSELSGGAQYHWANREWTYNARAEKSFFTTNQIAIGATYRLDYESAMDWAIPPMDSYLNSFFLGLETKNYHQVEGATGYIAFSRGNRAMVKAEYFDEEFSSLKKHTNWSFFNHRHKKEDNPPISTDDNGRLVGMRYSLELRGGGSLVNTGLLLEVERTYDRWADTLPGYTRLFGNASASWRLTPDNILKIRFAGGHSDDILPSQKAFRLGGLNTLRGFDFESIPGDYPFPFQYGGNRMVLGNIEYFLGGEHNDMGFIVFADAGGVWVKNQDFDIADIKRDIGIGLAFGEDFFSIGNDTRVFGRKVANDTHGLRGLRINWAVPVGDEPHVSNWTVNFVRAF